MVFQVSTSVVMISSGPPATLGTINFTAILAGVVPTGSTITLSFESNVNATGGSVGGSIVEFGPAGPLAPTVATATASGNTVTVNIVSSITFSTGDQLWISGIQLNPATWGPGVGNGFTAVFSAVSANPTTEPITFSTAIAPVARFA
jgi:hypothetical protein